MLTCILSIFEQDAFVLVDPGVTHSFISCSFIGQLSLQSIHLDVKLEVFTPTGLSL